MAIIDAQAVSKRFLLRHNPSFELKVRILGLWHHRHRQLIEEFWALKNVSLRIDRGEAVGLIGRNGSGKSTFLKLVGAIHRPTTGRVLVGKNARISSMIELGVGFHGELTGKENVFLNAAIHGLTRPQTEAIYGAIVQYSGLEHFIDVPIKNYSSGMHMRLGFAIAANLDPDILLLDEIFAVGDADFQQRCIGTLRGFLEQGRTIIFVSHSASAVQAICQRVCVLEEGELAFDGDVDGGLSFYDRLVARRSERSGTGSESAPSSARLRQGGSVEETVDTWSFDFLRREGLQPHHHVLHVRDVSRPMPAGWPGYLTTGRYVSVDDCAALVQLDRSAVVFDFAVAESIFASEPFNVVARCVASVVNRLRGSGRFYATWYENPDPANFEPITQANGVTTYSDRRPYHYPLGLIANICDAVGATAERVSNAGYPAGAPVLVISRKA